MKKPKQRSLELTMTAPTTNKRIESDYYIEGYATTWKPYVLFRDEDGKPVYEQILATAFEQAKMDDVILQYDHEGRVFARMTNGTLGMEIDANGLFIWADLGKTQAARDLYEDIQTGMVTKMSWRFFIDVNGDYYDSAKRTFFVTKVREILDVSAVSIPANNQTSITARKQIVEDEMNEKLKRERQRKKLEISLKIGGLK